MFDGVLSPPLVNRKAINYFFFSNKTVDLKYQEFIWWKNKVEQYLHAKTFRGAWNSTEKVYTLKLHNWNRPSYLEQNLFPAQ